MASIISPCVSSINTGFFSSVFLRHGCQSLLMIRRMTSVLTRYDFHAHQSTEYISTCLFLASCIPSHQSMYPPVISITTVSSASPCNDKPPSCCPLVCFLPSYVFFYLCMFSVYKIFVCTRLSPLQTQGLNYDKTQFLPFVCITLLSSCSRSLSCLTRETRMRLHFTRPHHMMLVECQKLIIR